MSEKRLARSVRKFLRRKKAEIRRQFLSPLEAEEKIRDLVAKTRERYTQERSREPAPKH